jgi:hypothetical protein
MSRARPPCRTPAVRGLAALIVAATLAVPAPAQAPQQQPVAVRTDALRWLLGDHLKFEPVSAPLLLTENPKETVLIVLGDLKWLQTKMPGSVTSFVEQGGALLAASDKPTGEATQDLMNLAGVWITPSHVVCGKKDSCYQNQPDMPFVVSSAAKLPDGTANPFDGLKKVATNIPSALIKNGPLPTGTEVLAIFPRFSDYDSEVSEKNKFNLKVLTFAVGGQRGEGRFLVLADHSVFINEMMLAKDTDNIFFTRRCLAWLGSDGQRKRAMLVEDGYIYPNFNVALRKLPPIPPLKILEQMFLHRDELVEESQRRFAQAEQDGRVDAGIMNALGAKDQEGTGRLSRYLWWGIGGCLAGLVFYRLRNEGRHLPETGLPRLGAAVAGQRPAAPLFEQRQRAQVAAGNLWEAARGLARQRLGPLAGSEGPPAASLVAGGGWRRRRAARTRLRRLWEIAYGSVPVAVPPARWEFFLAELEAFQRDVADGTVKLPAA